jgi:hypothetical protein
MKELAQAVLEGAAFVFANAVIAAWITLGEALTHG